MKKFLIVLACLFLIAGAAAAEDAVSSATLKIDRLPALEAEEGTHVLVVYFSPGDTVKAAAYTIASAAKADLFEIVPAEPYTEDDLNYYNSKARSMVEQRDRNARPAIAALPEDLGAYDTVFLCYPVWGGEAPRIICTFLEGADLSGKTVVPFATSNSSGIGSSDTKLHALTDETAVWIKGKGVKKGASAEDIAAWVLELGIE